MTRSAHSLTRLLVVCLLVAVSILPGQKTFARVLNQTADDLSRMIFGESIRVSQVYLSYDTVNPTKDHLHAGIDFAAPEGKTVKAVISGSVLTGANTKNNIYGTVSIFDGHNSAIYLHMKNISVNAGQMVNVGDKIGEVSSVNAPSVHLHIEVRTGKKPVAVFKTSSGKTPDITLDPVAYISGASAGASSHPGSTNQAGSQPALNQTSPEAVVQYFKYAMQNGRLDLIEKLLPSGSAVAELGGVFITSYQEGGQPLTNAELTGMFRQRIASRPICLQFYNLQDQYSGSFRIRTINWQPAWEITRLCYADCSPINPPQRSTSADFGFAKIGNRWWLSFIYLPIYSDQEEPGMPWRPC